MPKKPHEPFCVFKKQTPSGRVWYVKFWDNVTNRYASVKSTGIPVEGKRERRREAEDAARAIPPICGTNLGKVVMSLPLC